MLNGDSAPSGGNMPQNPFGGGTGGTIFISPIAFLVCKGDEVSILHLEKDTHLFEKVIDAVPGITSKISSLFGDMTEIKKI